ncbi:histidine kinase [Nonomuraea sp. NBC_01738]|uniref:sensor histidine kinase n=1 Tax=Nonomuraea sp. NBC_01738 TaxID=2976003 RepID=UPI002E10E76B|nr:histidine kinase [Nonomuraea sp. NBC_01738]
MIPVLTRWRRATRLDKVRWLIVYSTDFMYMMSLIGLLELAILAGQADVPGVLVAAGAVALLVFYGLSVRPFRVAVKGGPRPTLVLAIGGVLALALLVFGLMWPMPVWLGMIAPFVRRRTLVLLSLASIVVYTGYIWFLAGPQPALLAVQTVITLLLAGGSVANLWLWRVAREAHEGEEARARLAVSEERLRFARDLNDLLGQSLTGIAGRAERAEGALAGDPERAAAEMFEVRDLARRSLREVRATVTSYRTLDLGEVLASVRAVLEAADVHCVIDAELDGLPAETGTLLAAVVREGATNILKHSTAQRCTITIKNGVLEMSNDGIAQAVGEPGGLRGLSQRLSAAGGTLSATAHEGTYLLRAAV